jgi:hypothetical protein
MVQSFIIDYQLFATFRGDFFANPYTFRGDFLKNQGIFRKKFAKCSWQVFLKQHLWLHLQKFLCLEAAFADNEGFRVLELFAKLAQNKTVIISFLKHILHFYSID